MNENLYGIGIEHNNSLEFSDNLLEEKMDYDYYKRRRPTHFGEVPDMHTIVDRVAFSDYYKVDPDYTLDFEDDAIENRPLKLWSDLELSSLMSTNNASTFDTLGTNKVKFFLTYSKQVRSSTLLNKKNFDFFKNKKYNWILNGLPANLQEDDAGDELFTFFDEDIDKKKLQKFIQKPNQYSRLGGAGKYPMFILLIKTLRYLNPNY